MSASNRTWSGPLQCDRRVPLRRRLVVAFDCRRDAGATISTSAHVLRSRPERDRCRRPATAGPLASGPWAGSPRSPRRRPRQRPEQASRHAFWSAHPGGRAGQAAQGGGRGRATRRTSSGLTAHRAGSRGVSDVTVIEDPSAASGRRLPAAPEFDALIAASWNSAAASATGCPVPPTGRPAGRDRSPARRPARDPREAPRRAWQRPRSVAGGPGAARLGGPPGSGPGHPGSPRQPSENTAAAGTAAVGTRSVAPQRDRGRSVGSAGGPPDGGRSTSSRTGGH